MIKLTSGIQVALLTTVALVLGCQNLDTVNTNNPDESRSLSTPSDLEALTRSSFITWYEAQFDQSPAMGIAMMGDNYTCGWGNFGMSFFNREPRDEFINTTSGGARAEAEDPWFQSYGAISAATDAIRNIQSGSVNLGEARNNRAIAFGKFVQGLSHGAIAIQFDQGFILDETVDLNTDELTLVPYTEVMNAAIQQLEAAIQIANSNNFLIPDDWMNGKSYTNTELAKLAHSWIARYLALEPRRPDERRNVDWNKVLNHLDQGITEDFGIKGNGNERADDWYNAVQWYAYANYATTIGWNAVDYKLIGPSDNSGAYESWLALNPPDRDEILITSTDLRVWDGTVDANGQQNPGTQFKFNRPAPSQWAKYQRSFYAHTVYQEYGETNVGSFAYIYRTKEHDFLRAEALLHMGGEANRAEVAALLDKTHVNNGGYPSTIDLPLGDMVSDDRNPRHDNGATLWSVLQYERTLELLGTFPLLDYADMRGWGNLVSRTMLHFPVPAQDLETLALPLYSHGGTVGDVAKRSKNRHQRPRL